MTSIYQRVLDPDNNMTGDISLEYTCDWLSYYTHHTDMDDPQYVHNDVLLDYGCQQMLYCP